MRHKLFVIAALAVVLAACGGGGGSQNVTALATPTGLANAAGHTAEARTGHVEMTVHTTAQGAQNSLVASGEFDADQHLFSMSIDLSPSGSSPDDSDDPTSSSAGGGADNQIIATSDIVYLRFPTLASLLGVRTPWISTPADSSAAGVDVADPSAFLGFLRGAGGTVANFGHEQVRGVDTTHLHATVKLRDALNSTTGDERQRLQRAIDQLGQGSSSVVDAELPVDVYVDDQGMVRRLVFDFDAPATASGGSTASTGSSDSAAGSDGTASSDTGSSSQFTIDLFDFGAPVSIVPPPPDQVTDASAQLQQLTNGSTGG